MKSKNIEHLIEITPDLKQRTLKKLNLTQADVDNGVKLVTKWFVDQPHLPDVTPEMPFQNVQIDPGHVERLFVEHRGSIEATKHGLDVYYTLKTYTPEMFANRDPLLPELKNALDSLTFALLLPLTPNAERILCYKFLKYTDSMDANNFFKVMFMQLEMRMRNDYTSDLIVCADMKQFEPEHLEKMNAEIFWKIMVAAQKAYNFREKEIHFVNVSTYAEKFILNLKQTLKQDYKTQIVLHDSYEKLHQVVPKSLLPSDFGGELPSVAETQKNWFDEMIAMREFFLKGDKHIVDESKRVDKSVLDNIYKL